MSEKRDSTIGSTAHQRSAAAGEGPAGQVRGSYLRLRQPGAEDPPPHHSSDSSPLGYSRSTTAAATLWEEGHRPILRERERENQTPGKSVC